MSLRYLTPRDIAHMTPEMIARRQANWRGIIRGLQLEHERTFHGPERAAYLGGATPIKGRCGIAGCDRTIHARGMCGTHYQQIRRQERLQDGVA